MCFLGIFGDKKGQNLNIFLKYGTGVQCRVLLSWCVSSCPLGAGGALLLPLFGCVPSLSPCLCPFPTLLAVSLVNMALFRVLRGFLARFGVRMYVCMGLGVCVDCGAFVCVRG